MRPRILLTHAFAFLIVLGGSGLLTPIARAQSLCDLLPASLVKSTLGLTSDLTAAPNTQGGNGCDYKSPGVGPLTVSADCGNESEMTKMMFNAEVKALGRGGQRLSGMGDDAFYDEKRNQQMPKYPGKRFTQQSVVIRAKGKVISLIVMTPEDGIAKAAVISLGTVTLSKPIGTLKDPS
jgi:hypothetical protein